MTRYFPAIFLPCLLLLSACQSSSKQVRNLPQDEFIQAYFNHRQTGNQTYKDSYRQIERQGDNLEALIIKEIEAATTTIDLAVQELELPQIASALAAKHRSGVKVRVILDNNYSRPLSELTSAEVKRLNQRDRLDYEQFFQLVDRDNNGSLSRKEIETGDALIILHNQGIPLIDDTADGSKGSGLMHHKFLVIDRQKVITGSANFTLSGIHGDFDRPQTKGNVNHILIIDNFQLANLFTEEFNYMWGSATEGGVNSRFGLAKPARSRQTITWQNTKITVQFSPTSPTQDWNLSTNGLIAGAIADAKSSINLALFVFSDQPLANILEQKQNRGLNIAALFDPGFAFRYYSEALDLLGVTLKYRCQAEDNNRPWTEPNKRTGIPELAIGDKLHHKFAVIDEQTTIAGSQNWSPTANFQNDEAVLIIQNPTVASHFHQEFQRLYQSASLGLPPSIATKIKEQQQKCL